ncbi:uncharacterized protein [Musca autumnalis]|uniref:uncharacterized protein n=1 Tax=Musca autumnalis TaxID=221902 RepID=UPI003CECDE97
MSYKCIIIIVGFDKNRDGLEADIKAIKGAFSEHFEVELVSLINEDRPTIAEKYEEFEKPEWLEKFNEARFVTVFCLCHGTADGQIKLSSKRDTANCHNGVLEYDEVKDAKRLLLNPLFKIEQLDMKLKWLVVQACRGNMNDYRPMQRDGEAGVFPDYNFVSYCTGEGTVSFQVGHGGKAYIQLLCEEIRLNIREKSLCEMLRSVHAAVERFGETQNSTTFARPSYIGSVDDYNFFQ